MNRISTRLENLKSQGRKALVSYVVSGDPSLDATLPVMHGLVEQGVDIIELGIAFSDPMADGPVIQLGHERALANGVSLRSTLALVAEFRKTNSDTPIVLMGYANPIIRMGYAEFSDAAKAAGVDGLLTVDLPPEESVGLNLELKRVGIEDIYLIAPTTKPERIKMIAGLAGGFLYYVSLKGVTGAGHLDVDSVGTKVSEIRSMTDLPLCVGFGIKDAATAKAVGQLADGVVVGSALVKVMGEMAGSSGAEVSKALESVVAPLRKGLDEL